MVAILVTGTSSGIGLATAERLVRAGHTVYAGLRNPDTAPAMLALKEQGLPVRPTRLDLTDAGSIKAAIDQILADGGLDCIVNNAGIARGSNVEETNLDAVREMFETNFFGAAELIKQVLPHMRRRRTGTIVNVTSIAGRLVSVSGAFYAASKYAFEAYSESLAMQVAEFGIRVKIIEPGATTTEMFSNTEKAAPPINPNTPYQRMGRRFSAFFDAQLNRPEATHPDEVAKAIETAINTDDPQLRYVVGDDSETLLAGRQGMSDEDLIGYCRIGDDETFFDDMVGVYGRDLFRQS